MLDLTNLVGFNVRISSKDVDALAFLTAANITDPTQQEAVTTLVTDLKTAGVWDSFTAIYPFVGGSAFSHAVNLKAPGTFDITWNGTITHDSTGITPAGTDDYGDTGINCLSNLVAHNTHLAVYSRSVSANLNECEIGANNGSNTLVLALYIRNNSGNFRSAMYSTADSNGVLDVANTNAQGFYVSSRLATNNHKTYKNGSQVGTSSFVAGGLPSITLIVGGVKRPSDIIADSTKNLSLVSIGAGLTGTEVTDYSNAVTSFQTTLGRNV